MRPRPFPQYPTSYLTEVSGMNMKQKNAFCHTAPNFLEYSTLSHAPVVSVLYAVLSYVCRRITEMEEDFIIFWYFISLRGLSISMVCEFYTTTYICHDFIFPLLSLLFCLSCMYVNMFFFSFCWTQASIYIRLPSWSFC